MRVSISYKELSRQVLVRFRQNVTFSRISAKSLKVTYRKKALMVNIPVSVDISVAELASEHVALKYHFFVGVDQLISVVLKTVVNRHPDLKEALAIDGDVCSVQLAKVKNAKAFTQNFELKDIFFTAVGVEVILAFKNPDDGGQREGS